MAADSSSFSDFPMNCLRRYVFAALAILTVAVPGFAAEYRFDLTEAVGPSGACFGDCGFDLGVQFSRIDSAELLVRGTFTPSTYLRFGGGVPGEFTTGVFQELADNITWSFWLGDEDTAGFGDIVLGIDFEGINGSFEQRVDFRGIRGLEPNSFGLITYLSKLPADSTDLAFLLDGVGRLQTLTGFAGWGSSTLPITPHFDEITLILHGVAVPEPSAAVMGSLMLLASAGLRPCRAFLR